MMCIISKTIYLSSVFSLVYPVASFASFNPAYASLVDTSQNQTFESRPANFIKLAGVHFITNDNSLNFGNQEFLPGDLCKQGGYSHEGCPSGYVKGEACPYDSKFVKNCIDADTWCRNNGYSVTSCSVPKYLANPCPYKNTLYKSCETDNIRACKELGYSLTCETGKIGDSAQACPYNNSYKKCICNPCSGYAYTAAQASAQGYVPGEVCNSCGTMKYKRSENACSGYKTCDCGGETGAKVCYSGSVQKFDTCKTCCDSKFQYDSSNCTGGKVLAGASCGGKYDTCQMPLQYLYSDKTLSTEILPGKTIIGISVDPENRLAVALDYQGETPWGGQGIDIPTLENTPWSGAGVYVSWERDQYLVRDGKENTAKILAYGKSHGISYPAAEAAFKYQPQGCSAGSWCGAGNWFIPSNWQVFPYFDHRETILNMLKAIGRLPDNWWYIRRDFCVITSNEINERAPGFIYINTGGEVGEFKSDDQSLSLFYITY